MTDDLIVRGVTVIDGSGTAPMNDAEVAIRDGKFVAIRPADVRNEASVIYDGRGGYLLPGLWEGHTHLRARGEEAPADQVARLETVLAEYLAAGITTVLELGGPLDIDGRLRERHRTAPPTESAELFFAGPSFTGINGWPLHLHHNHALDGGADRLADLARLGRRHGPPLQRRALGCERITRRDRPHCRRAGCVAFMTDERMDIEMRVWDRFLTDEDRAVYAASGFGERAGFARRPAVIVVDVNYAFLGDRSEPILDSIKKWNTSCGPAGWNALPYIQRLLTATRERRVPVFFSTGVDLRDDRFDRGAWGFKNQRLNEQKIALIPNVRGNAIVAEIAPQPHEFVIHKYKPSVFFGTALQAFLVDLGIDTLLVCGTTTSGCVRATVIDAFNLNYRVSVIEECTFDRFESSHAMSLFDLNAKYADVIGTDDATAYLRGVEAGLYDGKIAFPLTAVS